VSDESAALALEILQELNVGGAGIARTRVDVDVILGQDATHSSLSLLDEAIAIVGGEQVVLVIALVDVEVLGAHVQYLQLGASVL
jgi:hypothetical protein